MTAMRPKQPKHILRRLDPDLETNMETNMLLKMQVLDLNK